ncbi:lasso peptide biosynthesis B2 protein [Aquisphaera insulae]|uniref:lasso peptide biosynthesis B2 protein n=1 Tax=Aquisphaera insulae TaxID=2712864 RepID=UPI0013EA358F|nr:lasso peptide biosynthesis B2 protein [Aquisphaera insulae]
MNATALREGELQLGPEVRLLPVGDGSARLIDLGGRFYSLSATAAEMLTGTLDGGPGEVAERIARRHEVDVRLVRADLDEFLGELRRARLIVPAGRPARHLPLAARGLLPALRLIHGGLLPMGTRVVLLLILARVGFRTLGWVRTVAAFRHFHRRHAAMPATESRGRAIDAAVRAAAASLPLAVECKERALACWSLARASRLDASLVVGINTHPLEGHCWCEAGGLILSDHADRCREFTPIATWA